MSTHRGISSAIIPLYLVAIIIAITAAYFLPRVINLRDTRTSSSAKSSQNGDFATHLKTCKKGSFDFVHPLTGDVLTRTIEGKIGGKCRTTEEMPNNGRMTCNFSAQQQEAAASYYAAFFGGSTVETRQNRTFVDGEEIDFSMNALYQNRTCVITGYEGL